MFLRNKSSFTTTSNDSKKVAIKSDGNVMRNTSNHDMIMEEHDEEQEDKGPMKKSSLKRMKRKASCTHFSERPFATGTVSCTLFSKEDSKETDCF
jgi:hypothetical protein